MLGRSPLYAETATAAVRIGSLKGNPVVRFSTVLFLALLPLSVLPAAAGGRTDGAPEADTFLWQVSRGGRPAGYLIGTVHVGKKGSTLSGNFQAALKDSRRLVLETEALDESYLLAHPIDALRLIRLTLSDRPLKDTLGQARLDKIRAQLKGSAAENLAGAVTPESRLAPQQLLANLGYAFLPGSEYGAEYGVDMLLLAEARRQGKPVHGLEFDEPLVYLNSIGVETAARAIDAMLADAAQSRKSVVRLIALHSQNRAREMWRVMKSSDERSLKGLPKQDQAALKDLFDNKLLKQRNQNWLPKLDGYLSRPGGTTVAVGAAHLFGRHGLIVQLRQRGYTVKPLASVHPKPVRQPEKAKQAA